MWKEKDNREEYSHYTALCPKVLLLVVFFDEVEDLVMKLITDKMGADIDERIYDSFLKTHSDEVITSQLNEILL
ncbi:MAG: hypothetical protein ACLUE2_12575 [Bacteroides cellulosilyticus]